MTESSTSPKNTFAIKDLYTPVAIVIAGICIGAGFYFSQSSPTGQPAMQPGNDINSAEAEAALENVAPVSEDDHIRGNVDAPITIVEYSDFDCPFCSRFHTSMKSVVSEYDGEVAWVYRQFPLPQLHPQAPEVALASECVASLGGDDAFWTFADGYFAVREAGDSTPYETLLPSLVRETGVDIATFQECYEAGDLMDEVQTDVANAVETGGRGTPWSILIGPSGKKYPINGAVPLEQVRQLIEQAKSEA